MVVFFFGRYRLLFTVAAQRVGSNNVKKKKRIERKNGSGVDHCDWSIRDACGDWEMWRIVLQIPPSFASRQQYYKKFIII